MNQNNSAVSGHALFRKYADTITSLIQEEGHLLRPYAHASLPYFSLLNQHEQKDIVHSVEQYASICTTVIARKGSLQDNRLMAEVALEKNGWEALPKDLDLITQEHLVEIYSANHTQVFRSLNFFGHSSYTFEDLCCRKWYHLYERNADDHAATVVKVHDFYNQMTPERMKPGLGEHKIQEKDTLERLICYSEIEWLVPVFRDSQLAGMMVLIKSRIES